MRIVFIKTGRRSVRQHYSPPLGAMSLASFLRDRRPGTEIKIIDMLAQDLGVDRAAREALDFEPDLIGMSALSYEARVMSETAQAIKTARPGLAVIAGGPHATAASAQALEDPNLDLVVRGEGEITLLEITDRIAAGEPVPTGVAGTGWRRDGRVEFAPLREEIVDLDTIPLPAYDLIDLPRYWRLPRFGTTFVHPEYAALFSSRACPYQCTYCHRIFGTRFRAQKPEIVLRDLETVARDFGVREIQFVDDCFNLDKKRALEICEGIRARGLKFAITFPNGLRGDLMDEEILDALKTAGVYRITYAIETGSPRLQKFTKKHVKLDKLKAVIEATDQRDIMSDGFFMVGFPGETREELQMTLDYAFSSRLLSANFWFVTPFQGTELYRQAEEMGLKLVEQTESMHYFDPETDLSEVPAAELKAIIQKAFIRFYLNPRRLYRIVKLFPNKKQLPALLLRAIKIALKWN